MNPSLPPLLAEINALISRPPASSISGLDVDPEDRYCTEEVKFPYSTTLEEYTGISFDTIPPVLVLNEEEWQLLADAFKQLFNALNISISDLPDDYPEEEFVELIRDHWDAEMIYYKCVGYDLSCCTGNNKTCPYGKECLYCGPEAIHPDEIFKPGYGGLFRDDGTQVDPLTVHIPELCLDCVSFLDEDRERNILCTLSRMSYDGTEEFICHAFQRENKNEE
ncbi:MAG: hypothetical protein GX128_08035 [Bacteroidales bacterium]|jgi:hypothetical protein|nr:hypothetical protein [Bacteroidales bacterium]